jgi:hypothetical protein
MLNFFDGAIELYQKRSRVIEVEQSLFNLTKPIEERCNQANLTDSYKVVVNGDVRLQIFADNQRV